MRVSSCPFDQPARAALLPKRLAALQQPSVVDGRTDRGRDAVGLHSTSTSGRSERA